MEPPQNLSTRLLGGTRLAWAYLLWFIVSDVALATALDRHFLPQSAGLPYLWFILHYAANPVLASVVAFIMLVRVSRAREARAIAEALLAIPLLVLIAYLGFTRNGEWIALWGIAMRGWSPVG